MIGAIIIGIGTIAALAKIDEVTDGKVIEVGEKLISGVSNEVKNTLTKIDMLKQKNNAIKNEKHKKLDNQIKNLKSIIQTFNNEASMQVLHQEEKNAIIQLFDTIQNSMSDIQKEKNEIKFSSTDKANLEFIRTCYEDGLKKFKKQNIAKDKDIKRYITDISERFETLLPTQEKKKNPIKEKTLPKIQEKINERE